MSQLFRIEAGLEIDGLSQILTASGAPGGTTATDGAPVGSIYQNIADGSLYTKITAGSGTNKWSKQASETYVNNAVGATVSWREPAVVRDNSATTLPSGTPGSAIVVNGVSITDAGRVLFSALSAGNGKNVYVYTQSTGIFVEDVNNESNGDAVYVQSGTDGGKTFIYNGSAWVQSDQASSDELGYINTFIGKPSTGSNTPSYSSHNFLVDGNSLKTSLGVIDTALGANVSVGNWITSANKINANIQAIDTKFGPNVTSTNVITSLATTGTVTGNLSALDAKLGAALTTGNFVLAADTAFGAIQKLDTQIGTNVGTGNFILSTNKVNGNITALDTALGANVASGTYILSSNSINANIAALDLAVGNDSKQLTVNNVTAVQTIDSIASGSAYAVKWIVHVVDAATSTNQYSTELFVLNNGTTVDYTKYATLKLGSAIAGLSVTADLSGGLVRLRVTSTGAVNVRAKRVSVVS